MGQEFRRQLARLGATSVALAAVVLLALPTSASAEEHDDEPGPADSCSTAVDEGDRTSEERDSAESTRTMRIGLASVTPGDLSGAVDGLAGSLDLDDVGDPRKLLTDLLGDPCDDTGDPSDPSGEDSDAEQPGDAASCDTTRTRPHTTSQRDVDGTGDADGSDPSATDDADPTPTTSVTDATDPDEDGPATTTTTTETEPNDADCVAGAGPSSGSGPSESGTGAGYVAAPSYDSYYDTGTNLAQPSGDSSPDAAETSPNSDAAQVVAQHVNTPHPLADTDDHERLPLLLATVALLAVGAALARTWQRRRTA